MPCKSSFLSMVEMEATLTKLERCKMQLQVEPLPEANWPFLSVRGSAFLQVRPLRLSAKSVTTAAAFAGADDVDAFDT